MKREVTPFEEEDVLRVLRERGKPMYWSRIVMAIRQCEYGDVKMSEVRGAKVACESLIAQGLAYRDTRRATTRLAQAFSLAPVAAREP